MRLGRRWRRRAGGFYAVVLLVVTPQTVFGVLISAQALIVTLFGGVGIFWGPVIGAAILVPLAETLHAELGNILPGIQGVVYGVAIIVIILVAPDGIYWRVRDRCWRDRAANDRAVGCHGQSRRRRRLRIVPAAPRTERTFSGDADPASSKACRASFGGLKAVNDVSLTVPRGRDLRHHRPERRRQDDAVQRAQRLPRGRQRQHRASAAQELGRAEAASRSAHAASAAPSRSCAPFRA